MYRCKYLYVQEMYIKSHIPWVPERGNFLFLAPLFLRPVRAYSFPPFPQISAPQTPQLPPTPANPRRVSWQKPDGQKAQRFCALCKFGENLMAQFLNPTAPCIALCSSEMGELNPPKNSESLAGRMCQGLAELWLRHPSSRGPSLSPGAPLGPAVLRGESQRSQTSAFPTNSSQTWRFLPADPVVSSRLRRVSRGWHMWTVASGSTRGLAQSSPPGWALRWVRGHLPPRDAAGQLTVTRGREFPAAQATRASRITEFFPLQMSTETRRSCRQAGLNRLAFNSHHLWVWHYSVPLGRHH